MRATRLAAERDRRNHAYVHSAAVGFGLGFFVALQLGPMSLFLIRSTLRGGWLLVALGVRRLHTALRVRLGHEAAFEVSTPRRAFLTSLAGTASNPATIVSWAAIFAAASTAGAARRTGAALLLVAGVAVGSLTWVTALASGVVVARRGIGDRAERLADAVAGVGLIGFGGALGYGAVHDR